MIYQELFGAEGYNVDVAADGEIAFQKILSGGYDLILLDISKAVMVLFRKNLPVIAELVLIPVCC